jgi:hypothetical protein
MGTRGSFPRDKAAEARSRGQENADLYIHSAICLHITELNYLSTGTTSPFLVFKVYYAKAKTGLEAIS